MGSVLGTILAVRLGNKLIVTVGLMLFSTAFLWISTLSESTSYAEIALQMTPLGLGLGLTAAPATEAIMGAVPPQKAGIGSGMNDATREVGGTLGVAIIGSVYASLYASSLASSDAAQNLPAHIRSTVEDSVGGAVIASEQLRTAGDHSAAQTISDVANHAFLDGLTAGSYVAAAVTALGALVAAAFLPSRPKNDPPSHRLDARNNNHHNQTSQRATQDESPRQLTLKRLSRPSGRSPPPPLGLGRVSIGHHRLPQSHIQPTKPTQKPAMRECGSLCG